MYKSQVTETRERPEWLGQPVALPKPTRLIGALIGSHTPSEGETGRPTTCSPSPQLVPPPWGVPASQPPMASTPISAGQLDPNPASSKQSLNSWKSLSSDILSD